MNARPLILFVVATICSVFASTLFAEEMEAVLQWQRTVPMSTPVSGVVIKVDAQVGRRVEKGHVLLKLDDRARRAQVVALQAKVKSAENNRDESRREMERTQELYDRTLIADHELELAKIQRDEATAQHQEAKATLMQAEMDLQYSTVRAPFTAWVTQRNVEVGQTIISELQAPPLVVLVDAVRMVARVQVSIDTLSKLRIGQKVKVTVSGENFQGKINHIALSPNQGSTDQYAVDVSFEVGDKIYRAGQSAEVEL